MTQGHDFGGLLLIEVAQRIRNWLRKMDSVSRIRWR
ncbi:MAG: diguanylate cyclase [Gallionella sp.]